VGFCRATLKIFPKLDMAGKSQLEEKSERNRSATTDDMNTENPIFINDKKWLYPDSGMKFTDEEIQLIIELITRHPPPSPAGTLFLPL
jgi:hypothetical protein